MSEPPIEVGRLDLRHPEGRTRILVGRGLLDGAAPEIRELVAGRRLFVIASRPVLALHPQALDALLGAAGSGRVLEVADGEAVKSPAAAEELWNRLLASSGKRDSLLAVFGGGSVGDLGGFVAATFLRGIDLVQIPTTLLAQVDAAIGGKTGINLAAAKNSVGAFHHPLAVWSDTDLLATLPSRELRSGLVEVIKMAALLDLDLLARLERDLDRLLVADSTALAPVVTAAAAAKARVVEEDPREGGRRKLLNFGHTLGHALEAAAGYDGLRHGEAVGWGIRFALRLAARRGLPAADGERIESLLDRLELPPLPAEDPATVLRHLGRDKKAREGGITWVLPRRLGAGVLVDDVGEAELTSELREFLVAGRGGGDEASV